MRTKFSTGIALDSLRGLTAFLAGFLSLFSGAVSAAVVTSTWNGATDGNWNVDARWTNVPLMGGFPNNGNGGVATYDAVIDAVGAAYTVTLGTNITIEDLMLNSANATLNHTAGTFVATGAIALSAGTYQLNGGTISNTTINVSGAGSLVIGTNSNNLLTGVTVNGDLNLNAINAVTRIGPGTSFAMAHMANQSAELGFLTGATMNGMIVLEGAGGGTRFIGMNTAGSLTIGSTGVIRTNAGLGGNAQIGVGNNFFAGMALTNNGLISSQVSGRTITINAGTSFANSGNLEALNGGILSITTAGWTNTGIIAVGLNSVVNLGPLNATGGIGSFNNTGGTVNITGTIDNTGNAIQLDDSTGSWALAGGALSGGMVNFADGTSLIVTANSNNLLTGVTVNGDLNLLAINAVTRIGPGTNFVTAHVANQSAELGFLAGATMNGTILLEGAGGGTRFIGMNTVGSVTIGATGVIRTNTDLGGNVQLGIGNNYFAAMTLINNGLISSEVGGRTITINALGMTNGGTGKLSASNGGILSITPTGAWTNGGTIMLSSGGVVNLGGTFDATGGIGTFNNTGGTVNITGTLNAGSGVNALTLNNSTGSWTLAGGTLSGGTVNFADGTSLIATTNTNSLLTGVAINGDLNLLAINTVTRIGPGTSFATAHLANQNAELGFLAGATMNGTILLEGAGGGTRYIGMNTVGSLTIGATGVIRTNTGLGSNVQLGIGSNYFAGMALTNNGLISSEVGGRTITINAETSFANSGNLEALNGGILSITTAGWTNTGTIVVGLNSVVNLGPLNATGGIGSFNNTGGTVNITGTIDNTGNTIQLNNSTGSWTLAGGTLSGGTVNFADGTSLIATTNTNNLLTAVTINGDLNLTAINTLTRIGPGTRFATAHLANQNTELGFLPGATMNGTILLEGAAVGSRFIGMNSVGSLTIGATGVIRTNTGFGGNAQVGIGNNFFAAMTLTNNGLISSQVSGRTITINAASFTNNATGVVEAIDGGILTIPSATTLTNYNSATQTLANGSWIVGTGATVTLNRSSDLLLNDADITLSGSGSVFRAGSTAALESTLTGNSKALRILAGRNYSNANPLSNTGVLQLGGGTLGATTLTNSATGEIFGFGTISVRPVNSGLIRSSGGVLILSGGIGSGGTVQIDIGSTVDLSPAATGSIANLLTHNGTAAGSLNLGAQNFTVDGDYTNASFGVGNTFAPRANVAGAGQIIASGPIVQSLSGDVTGGTTATPSLTLPNVHVGDVVTRNYKINNVGASGPRLRGAIQTSVNGGNLTDTRLSGSGVTASNFGPILVGGITGDLAVTLNATTAGALTNQTVRILNNFDNVSDQTLSIVGAAYRFAAPNTHTPEPVTLGNFHVGDTAPSQALGIMNNVPNDGFSESLNASISGFTGGATGSGSFNQLAPAATNNTSLIVGISTATAGSKNGTATISFLSDGTGSSGLGTTPLTAQTVNVTGAVYRLAQASAHTPEPVNFGTVRVGTSLQQVLTVSNNAANDGFSERLSGSLSGATGSATATGSFTLLAAGASDSTSLLIGLLTATPGVKTGTATLNLVSDGTGTSGLGQSNLTAQTVNVQGTVNALANPVFTKVSGDGALSGSSVTFNLEFGVLVQGAPTQVAQLRLDNFVVAPADALGGSFTLAAANFGLSGFATFNNLAPGNALSGLSVSFAPNAEGDFNGSVTLAALSQNGSQTDQALGNYVFNLHAQVIPESSAISLFALGSLGFARRRRC